MSNFGRCAEHDTDHCLIHHALTCCLDGGAASRSEQSAECPGPKCPLCSGEACNLCGTGALRCEPPCTHDSEERHREHQPAAEAAQSPQVGAALARLLDLVDAIRDGKLHWSHYDRADYETGQEGK